MKEKVTMEQVVAVTMGQTARMLCHSKNQLNKYYCAWKKKAFKNISQRQEHNVKPFRHSQHLGQESMAKTQKIT